MATWQNINPNFSNSITAMEQVNKGLSNVSDIFTGIANQIDKEKQQALANTREDARLSMLQQQANREQQIYDRNIEKDRIKGLVLGATLASQDELSKNSKNGTVDSNSLAQTIGTKLSSLGLNPNDSTVAESLLAARKDLANLNKETASAAYTMFQQAELESLSNQRNRAAELLKNVNNFKQADSILTNAGIDSRIRKEVLAPMFDVNNATNDTRRTNASIAASNAQAANSNFQRNRALLSDKASRKALEVTDKYIQDKREGYDNPLVLETIYNRHYMRNGGTAEGLSTNPYREASRISLQADANMQIKGGANEANKAKQRALSKAADAKAIKSLGTNLVKNYGISVDKSLPLQQATNILASSYGLSSNEIEMFLINSGAIKNGIFEDTTVNDGLLQEFIKSPKKSRLENKLLGAKSVDEQQNMMYDMSKVNPEDVLSPEERKAILSNNYSNNIEGILGLYK